MYSGKMQNGGTASNQKEKLVDAVFQFFADTDVLQVMFCIIYLYKNIFEQFMYQYIL